METPKNVCLYMFCMLNMHLYCIYIRYLPFYTFGFWHCRFHFQECSWYFMVFHLLVNMGQGTPAAKMCQDHHPMSITRTERVCGLEF